jgi:hypothetical protein
VTPDFRYEHGAAAAFWPDSDIRIAFDLIRTDNRSGETSAEVVVTSTRRGESGPLHRARLPLLSTVARASMAKHLGTRTPGQPIDWSGLLESSCNLVLLAHREAAPTILLRDAEEPSGDPFLLAPLILDRHLTIWFGDGGSLKSYLGLAAAISIQAGDDLLGVRPGRKCNVALLDWEFDGWEHKARMCRLLGRTDDLPPILYRRCEEPLYSQVDSIRKALREHEVGAVVIDSLAFACDGPPEESETARRFMSAVRRLGVPALAIAHVTKGGDHDRPFGSAFWHNGARLTWFLEKQQEVGDNELVVGLFNKKANTARLHPPLAFKVTFGGTRTLIERTSASESFGSKVPNRLRIAELLKKNGPMDYDQLGSLLELAPDVVRITVSRAPKMFLRLEGPKHRVALIDNNHEHPNSSPNKPEQFGSEPRELALEAATF